MAKRELPSRDLLRQLLTYDPATGKLFWLERGAELFDDSSTQPAYQQARAWNNRNAGREAFTASDHKGYLQGQVAKYHTTAHRVIWAWLHGEWPDCLDHIDGDGTNNQECNLRSVDWQTNSRNVACRAGATQMGVRWTKGAWEAHITSDRKQVYLGRFLSKDDAIAARKEAERVLGYHPNHGRRLANGRPRRSHGLAYYLTA